MNENGTPGNLIASHPGNVARLQHGLYSTRREITPEVLAFAEDLMQLPHVAESDWPSALEVAKLSLLVDRVDAALSNGVVENRSGKLRALVDQRRRLSAQLERWYAAFGLTPSARAEWAAKLGQPSFKEAVEARLRAEREAKLNGD